MEEKTLSIEEYVKMTIENNIVPFEIKYYPVLDLTDNVICAYRGKTTVNSIVAGTLQEKDYVCVSDNLELATELFRHNVAHTIEALKAFEQNGSFVDFISVRCPRKVVEEANMYDLMKDMSSFYPNIPYSKLCIEFEESILKGSTEKLEKAIMDLKLLNIKSAIGGCGSKTFPTTKLISVKPTMVFLDQEATSWATDVNKPRVLSNLITLIKSMDIDTIAQGDIAYYKALQRSDSIGFIDSNASCLSLEEAMNLTKGDDSL